jgi:hypothetical protein
MVRTAEEMGFQDHPEFCPVMNMLCPQGEDSARECRVRFEGDFNPLSSFRDFDIICCSYKGTEEIDRNSPLV